MDSSLLIALAVVVVVLFFLVSMFNKLVTMRNRYQNAFSQIEVQLKRRYDLIPNLVNAAKAYMKHESETLEAVVKARNEAMSGLNKASGDQTGAGIAELAGAEKQLTAAMGRFNMVMESYPDLKANQNMMQLSEEMTSTENKIAFARQGYNDSVTGYNSYKQQFPAVVFAGMFGHSADAKLLEFEDSAALQKAPEVSF
ncbi:LemA family protein [Aliagarivorans marinus]|uniref:LemA family protein n=1 Tax=Aliagarivorans marinus TaxID=561965 RepID=UPI0003F85712|nr:LemA family protein [Aliagarivorans marinus]